MTEKRRAGGVPQRQYSQYIPRAAAMAPKTWIHPVAIVLTSKSRPLVSRKGEREREREAPGVSKIRTTAAMMKLSTVRARFCSAPVAAARSILTEGGFGGRDEADSGHQEVQPRESGRLGGGGPLELPTGGHPRCLPLPSPGRELLPELSGGLNHDATLPGRAPPRGR